MPSKKTAPGKRQPSTARTTLVPVVVANSHRSVFFGYASPDTLREKTIRLERARHCLSWVAAIGGALGLAHSGPNDRCRIGAECPALTVHDITGVAECTELAAQAFAKQPAVS